MLHLLGFLTISQIMHGSCASNDKNTMRGQKGLFTYCKREKKKTHVIGGWCQCKPSKESKKPTKERECDCNKSSDNCKYPKVGIKIKKRLSERKKNSIIILPTNNVRTVNRRTPLGFSFTDFTKKVSIMS